MTWRRFVPQLEVVVDVPKINPPDRIQHRTAETSAGTRSSQDGKKRVKVSKGLSQDRVQQRVVPSSVPQSALPFAHMVDSPVPQPEKELAQLHTSGSSTAGSSWSTGFFRKEKNRSRRRARVRNWCRRRGPPPRGLVAAVMGLVRRPGLWCLLSSRRGPSCTTLRGSPSSIRSARSPTTGTSTQTLLTGSAPLGVKARWVQGFSGRYIDDLTFEEYAQLPDLSV